MQEAGAPPWFMLFAKDANKQHAKMSSKFHKNTGDIKSLQKTVEVLNSKMEKLEKKAERGEGNL
eukprot:7051307-Karenia_brevis.AAC.1